MSFSLDYLTRNPIGFASSGATTAVLPPPSILPKKPAVPYGPPAPAPAAPAPALATAPKPVVPQIRPTAPATSPAPAPATPSGPTVGGVSLKGGLNSTQISGLQALASKPVAQWTDTDKKNWAYATGGGAMPTMTPTAPTATNNVPSEAPKPAVPNVPDANPASPTTPPIAPTPTAAETADKEAEKAYLSSLALSPEEQAAQADLDRLNESYKTAYTNIGDQAIPLDFITGQQKSVEQRALNLAEPLQAKLARMQAARTAATSAAQFGLQRADKAVETERAAAADKKAAEREASKPFNVNQGDTVLRLNPTTGKYESVFTAAPKPLSPSEKYGSGTIGEYQFYADQERSAGREPMSFNEYQTMDANRKARAVQMTADGLDSATAGRVDRIAGQFDNEQIVKNYTTQQEAKNFVDSISDSTSNPADQIGLIYAFAKAMDPGSVVREGEYATAQKYIQSWATTFGFDAKRAFAGGTFLSPDAMQKMKSTINSKFSAVQAQYNNLADQYGRRIDQVTGRQNGRSYVSDYSAVGGSGGGGNDGGQTDPLGLGFNGVPSTTKNGSLDTAKVTAAIGQFESGGRYNAIGKQTASGDRAYGKYQIMGANIPSWTREVLGKSMTIQQFLADSAAQDKVAHAKISQYVQKYGTVEDAASMWFSGKPLAQAGNRKDVNGTTVPGYAKNVRSIYNRMA